MPKTKKVSVGIVSTGIYIPERIVTNADLEKIVDTSDEWIRTRTGIRERRILNADLASSDMAHGAAQMALENAGLAAEDIDLLIVATFTPDMAIPSTACLVQDKLGAKRAAAFDLAAGCTGFVYAMAVGSQFIETGMYKTALIIGVECSSRIIDWKDRGTCVIFGDGAGAVVLRQVEEGFGIKALELGSDGSGADLLKQAAGGSRMPITQANCESSERYLSMAGGEVFKFAVRIVDSSTRGVIKEAGLSLDDIDCLVLHQANSRIIEAASKRLNIPREKVFMNLDKYGNTSAASIPMALHEASAEGKIKKGDHVVIVGFGAGLTWGASVIKWAI